jgi:hypothetical protein
MAKTRVIIRGRDHQKTTGGTNTVAKAEDPSTMTTTAGKGIANGAHYLCTPEAR